MTHEKKAREIERYGLVYDVPDIGCVSMNKTKDGDWVSYEDHQKALASAEKKAWNEAISAAVKVAKDRADNDFKCICGLRIAESIGRLKK